MIISVTGVTLTGNMGGVAMLMTLVQQASKRLEKPYKINLLSLTPQQDKRVNTISELAIVSAKPLKLLLCYMPLSYLVKPLLKFKWLRRWLNKIDYFKAIDESDLIIDLSGIAFVDKRGVPLLAYNVAVVMPSLMMNKPVHKLSQALGDFNTWLNAKSAQYTLSKCEQVVARGEYSLSNLKKLNLTNTVYYPDTTFALTINDEFYTKASNIMASVNPDNKKLIVISPSEVVKRLCDKNNIDLAHELANFIVDLDCKQYKIILLPHSFGSAKSKNNDLSICQRIMEITKDKADTEMIKDYQDPTLLRALIGQAHIFIGCRFHSVVSALAMSRPTIVIGWSHKYLEMIKPVMSETWCVQYELLTSQRITDLFLQLCQNHATIESQMKVNLEKVIDESQKNFSVLGELNGQ